MSNISQFFGSGGSSSGGVSVANPFYRISILKTSGTFTAPLDGTYLITCIGAGGTGSSTGNSITRAGGGAGGLAQKAVSLTVGQQLTCVVGAAGASGTNTNGGTSTVSGTGISLTANGGMAGSGSVAGAGGSASGGTFNYTGGSGYGSAATSYGGGGGGAVSLYGVTANAVNITGASTGGGGSASSDPSALYGTHFLINGRILTPVGFTNGAVGCYSVASPYTQGGIGGTFAGGTGGYDSNVSGYGAGSGGSGGLGGGGGGGTAGIYSSPTLGGAGGNGVIIVEWFSSI